MNCLLKSAILGVAVVATSFATLPAQAHGRHHDRDGLALGLGGLAVGTILGGALSQPRYSDPYYGDGPGYRYYEPEPVYVAPPPPVYAPPPANHDRQRGYRQIYHAPRAYSAQPRSEEWYRACSARYRSFDPRSGTYHGYDGRRHVCR